jgi:hypothetical protein
MEDPIGKEVAQMTRSRDACIVVFTVTSFARIQTVRSVLPGENIEVSRQTASSTEP